MEQAFALRVGVGGTGELTLFEQNILTAEDRAWWITRLKRLADDRDKNSKVNSGVHIPNVPHT